MARLTKQDVISSVAEKAELTKKQAGIAVDALLDTVKGALANGDSVGLIGFGTFEVRKKAARDGRNPVTQEVIHIPAKNVPAFGAGKQLRESVPPVD